MRFLNGVDLAILAVGALGAGGVSPGAAQGDAVKAIFEKYDLLGTLAADCSNPGDARSDVERGRGVRRLASHPQCRTADAGCTVRSLLLAGESAQLTR